MSTFVSIDEYSLNSSERYYWLYCTVEKGAWSWTYYPTFGVVFKYEDDAILFKLKFA